MDYAFPMVWILACAFSADGMTMNFKEYHCDKKISTYKAEGDDFQVNVLCQYGFIYQINIVMIEHQASTIST